MNAPSLSSMWAVAVDDYPGALAWSFGASLLAVARSDGSLLLVDATRGESAGSVSVHRDVVSSVAWHPMELAVATSGNDGVVALVRPDRGVVTLVEAGRTWTEHLTWHPRGKRLAVARGRHALVIDPSRPGTFLEVGPVASTIAGLAWSRDGRVLAVACYGGIRFFDAVTGVMVRRLERKGSMLSVAWSPDGKVIAGGCQDQSVHFWRLPGGDDSEMSGFSAKPKDVIWSPDGRWLATSGGPTICLWPFQGKGPEGRPPRELRGHDGLVTAMAYAPASSFLVSGDTAGRVCHWLPDDHRKPVATHELPDCVTAVAWGAAVGEGTARWAAAARDGRVIGGRL